jgi:hypothetical protein
VLKGKGSVSDYEINASVRRELTSRKVDMTSIQYRTTNGAIEITGALKFLETKSIAAVQAELQILEENLGAIKGVRRVNFDLSDWERNREGKFARKLAGDEAPPQG